MEVFRFGWLPKARLVPLARNRNETFRRQFHLHVENIATFEPCPSAPGTKWYALNWETNLEPEGARKQIIAGRENAVVDIRFRLCLTTRG